MKSFLRLISLLLLVSFLLSVCGCNSEKGKQKYTKVVSIEYFDTSSTLIGYADSEEEFLEVFDIVESMLREYHYLYDIYGGSRGIANLSDINALENGEHKVVSVDERIMSMLLYAKEAYSLTQGETNIAMGSVLSLWRDAKAGSRLPNEAKLYEASLHTDIDNIILDKENMTVYISDPKMTLDVGAIAKGYATEMIAQHLEGLGIDGYLLNFGGNIRTIGKKGDGNPWKIGVENPDFESDEPYIEYVELSGEAFVTSGSYHRYYYVGDKKYHHIIDKDTLFPSDFFVSVSVLAEDSGMADALSTALFSMSYEDGAALVEGLSGVEAMWYTKDGKKLYSSGFSRYIVSAK